MPVGGGEHELGPQQEGLGPTGAGALFQALTDQGQVTNQRKVTNQGKVTNRGRSPTGEGQPLGEHLAEAQLEVTQLA